MINLFGVPALNQWTRPMSKFRKTEEAELRGAKIAAVAIAEYENQRSGESKSKLAEGATGACFGFRKASSKPKLTIMLPSLPSFAKSFPETNVFTPMPSLVSLISTDTCVDRGNLSPSPSGSDQVVALPCDRPEIEPERGFDEQPRIKFCSDEKRIVELNGEPVHVKSKLSWNYFRAVVEACGRIVKGAELSTRFKGDEEFNVTKAFRNLPAELKAMIKVRRGPGGGSWLKCEVIILK